MPRKTKARTDSPMFWEADQMDLQNYMDRRLSVARGTPAEPAWFAAAFDAPWSIASSDVDRPLGVEDGPPSEPTWFSAAFDASWPLVLAEAATWYS